MISFNQADKQGLRWNIKAAVACNAASFALMVQMMPMMHTGLAAVAYSTVCPDIIWHIWRMGS